MLPDSGAPLARPPPWSRPSRGLGPRAGQGGARCGPRRGGRWPALSEGHRARGLPGWAVGCSGEAAAQVVRHCTKRGGAGVVSPTYRRGRFAEEVVVS